MSQLQLSKILVVAVAAAGVAIALFATADRGGLPGDRPAVASHKPLAVDGLVELVAGQPATLRLTRSDSAALLGVRMSEVQAAPPPEPLRLPGTLALDPNKLIHVHPRFGGEAVQIGTISDNGELRPLRYGDNVKKGQVMVVIWSRDIGEKKSELMESVSRLSVNQALLSRLEGLEKGVVAERTIFESRRNVEADLIAVARAERTLRSCGVTETEIEGVRQEARLLGTRAPSGKVEHEQKWAEVEIRAAIDGTIVEKNFNVGDIVEPRADLFKLADLSRLMVLANVYEEDLWAVRGLPADGRLWKIHLTSNPTEKPIDGMFELIGSVIDPAQRTGVVMGWIDNPRGQYAVGQFVTATIQLPEDPGLLAIPETALIEEGDSATAFVETNPERRELTRLPVEVVRRTVGTVYFRGKPVDKHMKPLKIGQKVVISSALGLGGELSNLDALNPTGKR